MREPWARGLVFGCMAVACGGTDPGAPPGGPPGGVLTVSGDAFAGASGVGARAGAAGAGAFGALPGASGSGFGGATAGSGGVLVGSGGMLAGSGGVLAGSGGSVPASGGRAATAYCTGSATTCSLLGTSQCTTGRGCTLGGVCQGYSESCSSQLYSSSCYGVQGCVWSSYSKYCSGSSWSCDLFSGSSTCIGQPGCSWERKCDGSVTPCSLLSEFECPSQPGCYLGYR